MMYCVRSFIKLVKHSRETVVKSQRLSDVNRYSQILQQRCHFSSTTEDEADRIVAEICRGDADLEKKLRILMLEVEVMRQDGRYAPDRIRKDQWEHLLGVESKSQRGNYLRYLFKTEKARENFKAKKEAKRLENPVIKPEDMRENEDDLLYGIQHQSLFLRIRDQSMNMFDNYRALQAMISGQSLVIDCSYDNDMVSKEALNAAKQVTYLFGDNRIHKQPFNLHLCNLNMEGAMMKQLRKNIPSLEEPWFPLNMHTKSYLDIFPKEKLVYLTPHCREELTRFDHDAVYIVGCMVDKMNNEPLSLARAKRDGLKMAKLPLDRYLEWAPGSKKNLNINHMVPILLDLKLTEDWEYSLRHIPRRKLMETKIKAMEKKWQSNAKMRGNLIDTFNTKSNTFNNKKKFNTLMFREKRMSNQDFKLKPRRTLCDDDNI